MLRLPRCVHSGFNGVCAGGGGFRARHMVHRWWPKRSRREGGISGGTATAIVTGTPGTGRVMFARKRPRCWGCACISPQALG